MLKRTAEIQGGTMTGFLFFALEAAQRTIEETDVISLTLPDQKCFAETLLSPPQPA